MSVVSENPDSTVWLMLHRQLRLKRIVKGIHKHSPYYERLVGEAYLMKNLNHPCIPAIYDMEEDEAYTYIVEEFIEGESLSAYCNHRHLSEKSIINYSIQLCELIEYLHSLTPPVLHLDIKPQNIMVSNGRLWLIDFGSAVLSDRANSGLNFGTRGFCAPEQQTGGRIGKHTDIYSIGMLIRYLLKSGSITCSFRKQMEEITGRCIGTNIFRRYDSISKLTARLVKLSGSREKQKASGKQISVAVAGAAGNIGTTHVALLFSRFLSSQEQKCSYVDCCGGETYHILAEAMYSGEEIIICDRPEYDRISEEGFSGSRVFDLGEINNSNLQKFCEADYSVLILAGQPWEYEEAGKGIRLTAECRSCIYLYNLTDTKSFELIEGDTRNPVYRMPYEPLLWGRELSKEVRMLFERILF